MIRLSFQDAHIEKTIAHVHNPPAFGMKEDRASRGTESYAKDFKPLPLGTIRLGSGRGKMTLQATKVAGPEVAEVRYLVLTRR